MSQVICTIPNEQIKPCIREASALNRYVLKELMRNGIAFYESATGKTVEVRWAV